MICKNKKIVVLYAINIIVYRNILLKYLKRSQLWHEIRKQIICQTIENIIKNLTNLIPDVVPAQINKNKKKFSRDRKLPFQKLIIFIFYLTINSKKYGVDIQITEFFKQARRTGLWINADTVHRSAVTKARKKVPWQVFENIYYDAIKLHYEVIPSTPEDKWHNMSVFATDGSKYNLPATDELREKFDPQSGLEYDGKGHYPQCLVTTIYDVFRQLPVARSIASVATSERDEFLKLLLHLPIGQLLLFDRGYPSYNILRILEKLYADGYYMFRSTASNTFPAVEEFLNSGKEEAIIYINPSKKYLNSLKPSEREKQVPIKVRVIKLINSEGKLSVLLTNLHDFKQYPIEEVRDLYYRRWGVEVYYRDEKESIEIEKFHSKNYNGIMQELYAVVTMSIIARLLMRIAHEQDNKEAEPQFKHAVVTFSKEIIFLTSDHPDIVVQVFKELLLDIARVRYYKSKMKRKSQPRVCKKPANKWAIKKKCKLKNS